MDNSFEAGDLRSMQAELAEQIRGSGIDASIVESFPNYYGLQFQFVFSNSKTPYRGLAWGGYFDLASTGGRIQYKDYSGEVTADEILSAYSLGFLLEERVLITSELECSFNVGVPFIWCYLDYALTTRIGSSSHKENPGFNAFSAGLKPGISVEYTLNRFVIGLSLDYLVCIPVAFKLNNNSDATLTTTNGKNVTMGLNGIKAGLGIGVNF